MTPPENGKPLWNEARVESLLEEFFQKEIPPPLRGDHPTLPAGTRLNRPRPKINVNLPTQTVETRARARSFSGVAIVGFSTLMLLMMAQIFWPDSSSNPNSKERSVGQPETEGAAPGRDREGTGDEVLDALRQDGKGPVESRSRIRHVGTEDPMRDKPEFPELDIEVFPLDRDTDREEKPKQRSLPESQKSPADEHPMPEENRPLPEAQSGPADDLDDEADSLLPELSGQSAEPLSI